MKWALATALTAFALSAAAADEPAGFVFSDQQKACRFYRSFVRWAKQDAGKLPQPDAVLCIGSSSMLKWRTIHRDLAPLKTIHRGFGGSTMAHVLLFKDFFRRYRARRILIYEGDNDLMSKRVTPERFLENCRKFVGYIRETTPDAHFYFLSVKPSIRRQKQWPKFQEANALLKAYADSDDHITFVDVASAMLKPEGSIRDDIFVKDMLHMNAKGYALWTPIVRAALLGETGAQER